MLACTWRRRVEEEHLVACNAAEQVMRGMELRLELVQGSLLMMLDEYTHR